MRLSPPPCPFRAHEPLNPPSCRLTHSPPVPIPSFGHAGLPRFSPLLHWEARRTCGTLLPKPAAVSHRSGGGGEEARGPHAAANRSGPAAVDALAGARATKGRAERGVALGSSSADDKGMAGAVHRATCARFRGTSGRFVGEASHELKGLLGSGLVFFRRRQLRLALARTPPPVSRA